ncbi:MAG: hypothetical protein EAZ92_11185 [Candidatus Kapaibacterium sp.]|nr:MAG: hypothetical protein EAZ92_11185 [Candidatus Kapabacteria bacterium]
MANTMSFWTNATHSFLRGAMPWKPHCCCIFSSIFLKSKGEETTQNSALKTQHFPMKTFLLSFFLSINTAFALQIHTVVKKPHLLREVAASKQSSASQAQSSTTMKRDTTLKQLWNKVDSCIEQSLPKSALPILEKILAETRAATSENLPHTAKALVLKHSLLAETSENGEILFAQELEKMLKHFQNESTEKPENLVLAALLRSTLAEYYELYFSRHEWEIQHRQILVASEKYDTDSIIAARNKDFRTWDARQFISTIRELHFAALKDKKILQETPLASLKILLYGYDDGSAKLRPTLYDVIAFRAISMLNNTTTTLPKPENEFEVSSDAGFARIEDFIGTSIPHANPDDWKYQTLRLYQDILAFHSASKTSTDALLDVNRARLAFVNFYATDENKHEAYKQALERDANKYNTSEITAEYWCDLAGVFFDKGDYIKAREHLAQALAYKDSYGSKRAKALEVKILTKTLSLQTEKTVLPGAPFLVSVGFRNVEKVHFRLYSLPQRTTEVIDVEEYFYKDEAMTRLLVQKPVLVWSENLPTKDSSGAEDYKQHYVDVKVPVKPDMLPFGRYVVIASANENFAMKTNAFAWVKLTATRLALVKDRESAYITDAETGQPIKGVTVRVLETQYDKYGKVASEKLLSKYSSDEQGFCPIACGVSSRAFIELEYKGDMLRDGSIAYRETEKPVEAQDIVRLFTDRAFYRPGQTIFFKGIALRVDNSNSAKPDNSTLRGKQCTIAFRDVNDRVITEQTFTSNEYGSFHGTFTIPVGILNGTMWLRHNDDRANQANFRVEEYKRPKFEAKLLKPKELFRVGENVKVRGEARNYAGSALDGATVQFRVVRRARFPYWRSWWGSTMNNHAPQSQEKEIARGRINADEKGDFTLEFPALPDKSLSPETLPIFTYSVIADVTDISGETHTAETSVSVGYVAIDLDVSVPEQNEKAEILTGNRITIQTFNLNSQPLSTQGTVRLERLKQPKRILKPRFLPMPDRFLLSEKAFREAFPADVRLNEDDIEAWKADKIIAQTTFTTNKDGFWDLPKEIKEKITAGAYRIIAEVQDISGRKLESIEHFTVQDASEAVPTAMIQQSLTALTPLCKAGDTASFLISSAAAGAKIFFQVSYGNVVKSTDNFPRNPHWFSLSKEQHVISVPIPKDFHGILTVHTFSVRHHRLFTSQVFVTVPWTHKHLRVETSTFRDKTRPGSREEWTLTVRGSGAEKISAELAATLYDASLDSFDPLGYSFLNWKSKWGEFSWQMNYSHHRFVSQSFAASLEQGFRELYWNERYSFNTRFYADIDLDLPEFPSYRSPGRLRGGSGGEGSKRRSEPRLKRERMLVTERGERDSERDEFGIVPEEEYQMDDGMQEADKFSDAARNQQSKGKFVGGKVEGHLPISDAMNSRSDGIDTDLSGIKTRTNLQETAFFMPQLLTNEKGEIVLKFTMPESLTRWRMLAFAHTTDMKTGSLEMETVTQKELMILPNVPRFLREGDSIRLPFKISNLASKQIRGVAELKLFDALTMQELSLGFQQQQFSAEAGQSSVVTWSMNVPEGLQAVVYRIVAKASNAEGEFSDGEEAPIPVLPNRILVTETLPLWVHGNSEQKFGWKKLAEASKSATLRHQRLTLEISSNPAWYAIQALPMLMEYGNECTEQLWNKVYANLIAAHIVNSKPRIKAVFESWKQSKESLLSGLEKNQELKSLLLQETPWVLNAGDETERKRRVGLLFELNTMSQETEKNLKKVLKRQSENGGFTWFPGMRESRFITQYLMTGLYRLTRIIPVVDKRLMSKETAQQLGESIQHAVKFMDSQASEEYKYAKQRDDFSPKNDYLSHEAVQFLYTRSFDCESYTKFFSEEAFEFWVKQAGQHWQNQGLAGQCMIAIALKRFAAAKKLSANMSKQAVPEKILQSLRERALHNDELGMYWRQDAGWFWWQAPIETHALCIESFLELDSSEAGLRDVEAMKTWLLKQKQTNDWKTTKATADACYALLLRGADWLESTKLVDVKLGKMAIDQRVIREQGASVEAGSGYYKVSFGKGEITPDMGNVALAKTDAGSAWGGLYWQYFERLDKITSAASPLSLTKELFRQNATAKGLELEPITDKTVLRVGDVVQVRVVLRSDRDMEYIHLHDMRGAGLEPLTTLSGYKWQSGLGYYETMRDASANFFIGWLPSGVWVFEYGLRVTHEGTFQNGITKVQSMYAPEFSSHSEGVLVRVGGR